MVSPSKANQNMNRAIKVMRKNAEKTLHRLEHPRARGDFVRNTDEVMEDGMDDMDCDDKGERDRS